MIALNPGLPLPAYQDALRQIVEIGAGQSGMTANREKYRLLRDGVKVGFRKDDGSMAARTLRVFDFDTPDNNGHCSSPTSRQIRKTRRKAGLFCVFRTNAIQPGHIVGSFGRSLRGRPMLFTITRCSTAPSLPQIDTVRLLPALRPSGR